jgi:hypothetical protein
MESVGPSRFLIVDNAKYAEIKQSPLNEDIYIIDSTRIGHYFNTIGYAKDENGWFIEKEVSEWQTFLNEMLKNPNSCWRSLAIYAYTLRNKQSFLTVLFYQVTFIFLAELLLTPENSVISSLILSIMILSYHTTEFAIKKIKEL